MASGKKVSKSTMQSASKSKPAPSEKVTSEITSKVVVTISSNRSAARPTLWSSRAQARSAAALENVIAAERDVIAQAFAAGGRQAGAQPDRVALAKFDASFTGRKAFQASTRAHLPRFEIDTSDAQGRLKINPLIDWDASQIEGYMIQHDLPRHPLVAQGYPSIGCSPCTTQVAPGEDPRSGRWKGWDKTECGIHKPGEEPFL